MLKNNKDENNSLDDIIWNNENILQENCRVSQLKEVINEK